ncbi:MAG: NUDIX hydrolase [Smithellaceae bacterium]
MEQELNKIYPLVPRIGVGGITIHEGRVLLVKRGVAPNRGQWAIPGGTLQLGETLQECVAREIFEETGITIKVGVCAYVFDYLERDDAGKVKYHFVVVDYIGEYVSGEPKGGDDAEDAGWFKPEDLYKMTVAKNSLAALREIGFLKDKG